MQKYTIKETFTLPSKGKMYTNLENPSISLRSMTTRDEMKRLAPTDTPYKAMSEIIEECIIGDKPSVGVYNLFIGDYEFLLQKLRIVKKNTLILPDDLPFEKAAFSEPLANVVHGVERTEIKPGQSVGVIGIGPIGLMFARLAKLKGARVIVAGRNPIKLKLADEFAHADGTLTHQGLFVVCI